MEKCPVAPSGRIFIASSRKAISKEQKKSSWIHYFDWFRALVTSTLKLGTAICWDIIRSDHSENNEEEKNQWNRLKHPSHRALSCSATEADTKTSIEIYLAQIATKKNSSFYCNAWDDAVLLSSFFFSFILSTIVGKSYYKILLLHLLYWFPPLFAF